MNPLNPAASSLNAERARVDAGEKLGAGAGDTPSGGFADLLRGMGAPAKEAAPVQRPREAPALNQASLPERAAPESAVDIKPTQPPQPRDTAPTAGKPAAARPAKAQARAADEASSDAPRAEGKDAAASDVATPQSASPQAIPAPANDPPPTLAHWLLHGSARAMGGDSPLPPPAQPSAAGDEQEAAALTRDLLQGLRSGVGRGAGDRALGGPPNARVGAASAAKDADVAGNAGTAPGTWAAAHLGHEPVVSRAERGAAEDKPSLAPGAAASTTAPDLGAAAAAAAPVMNPTPPDLALPRAVVEHPIHTPVGAPGFGEEVALSIATLNRGGVHEARLQLNPAELGPVSVHIEVVDGTARVDLGAAQAATRQLLEAALPALAEAFKADGLNLASSQVADGWTPPAAAAFGSGGFDMAGDGGRRGAPPDGHAAGLGEAGRSMGAYGAAGAGAQTPGSTAGDPLWSSAARRGAGGLDLYA